MNRPKRHYILLSIFSVLICCIIVAIVSVNFDKREPSHRGEPAGSPHIHKEDDKLPPPHDAETLPQESAQPDTHQDVRMPPHNADNLMYYRGARTISDNEPLIINRAECKKDGEKTATLEIIFNQSINPKSVNHTSFFIDGKQLPDGTRFSFNKKGDTIKITIPVGNNSFTLSAQGIISYDGTQMEPAEIQIDVTH